MEWQVIVCVSTSIEEKIKGNKKKRVRSYHAIYKFQSNIMHRKNDQNQDNV